jgi:CDP-diacylglycerol--serine O-phosphatidyltransferase
MNAAAAIHLSNALTYASLLCGISALSMALRQNAAGCGALLALAVVFDTFDGRFARCLRRRIGGQASIGVQLDSLVDAVTFGIVPIACASVLFSGEGLIWWLSAFAYVACAVTRLGAYNVSAASSPETANLFVGLPTPVAALFWSSLFLTRPPGAMMALVAVVAGAAMIAPLRIGRPRRAGLALFVMWPAALILFHAGTL